MRLTSITIENFKNVEYGRISLVNPRTKGEASILALYGQNGSGKSALVDSLLVFKCLMSGEVVPDRFAYYIRSGAQTAKLTFEFEEQFGTVQDDTADGSASQIVRKKLYMKYEVEFARNNKDELDVVSTAERANDDTDSKSLPFHDGSLVRICSESIKGRWEDDARLKTLFYFKDDGQHIGPKNMLSHIRENSSILQGRETDFLKSLGQDEHAEGRSIIPLLQWTPSIDSIKSSETTNYPSVLFLAIMRLTYFAPQELFVVGTKESESIESGKLTFFYNKDSAFVYAARVLREYETDDPEQFMNVMIKNGLFDEGAASVSTDPATPTELSPVLQCTVSETISSINRVLDVLVPGLSLGLNLTDIPNTQDKLAYIETLRDSNHLPLSCESRGIQKLVSVAWLLVGVYNIESFTAVIDELDSGIFEYLLGEILEVLQDEGRGQLIFTSHNLRALEKLDKSCIVFTSTNPKNRYVRLKNIKTTNNLRDVYLRYLYLDDNNGELYKAGSAIDLSDAFMLAGNEAFIIELEDKKHGKQ